METLEARCAAKGDPAKRRQIVEGACRVFLAQGYDAASMGAIAREAGVSKGTLYVYFKDKEELFDSIIDVQCRQQAELLFKLDDGIDLATALRRLGRGYVQFLCRPNAISPLRTVIAIADRMPALGERFYRSGPARGIASLKAYLEARVAAGELHPHDCEVAAAQFMDSCVSTIFRPMLFNCAGPPNDARIEHVVYMAVDAFLAAYGQRPHEPE